MRIKLWAKLYIQSRTYPFTRASHVLSAIHEFDRVSASLNSGYFQRGNEAGGGGESRIHAQNIRVRACIGGVSHRALASAQRSEGRQNS